MRTNFRSKFEILRPNSSSRAIEKRRRDRICYSEMFSLARMSTEVDLLSDPLLLL
jgi:hypothetical protein